MKEVELLNELVDKAKRLTFSKPAEVDAITRRIETVLQGIFGKVSGEYWDFKRIGWGTEYNAFTPSTFERSKQKVLNFLEAKILQLTHFGAPVNFERELQKMVVKPQTQQVLYETGQAYDAIRTFLSLVREAKRDIVVIDGYISERTLEMLSAKGNGVEANILTHKVRPDLKVLCEAFNKQYGNLSVRTSSDFHDRFLVIDMVHWYIIGASIKDAGNKIFAITQVTEPEMIRVVDKTLRSVWSDAAIIL